MNQGNRYTKWAVALFVVLAISLAFSSKDKNTLALLELAGKVVLLLGSIYSAIKATRERKARGLSKDAFLMEKAGGPKKLLEQANSARLAFYLFVAIPIASCIYAAINGSMDVAVQMFLITGLITSPFTYIIYRHQKRMRSIAIQELTRQQEHDHHIAPHL